MAYPKPSEPSVLLQRVTSNDQQRRLVAAAVRRAAPVRHSPVAHPRLSGLRDALMFGQLTAIERDVLAPLAHRAGLAARLFDAWAELPSFSPQTASTLTAHAQLGVNEERGAQEVLSAAALSTTRRSFMLRQGRGVITNISSIAAVRYTGYPYPAYYASKAGLNQLTVSIAMEHAARGIRANVIMPGLMDTPHIYKGISGQYASEEEMVKQRAAQCPMGRMGTGWDIAKAAAFLASDDAQYITGVCLPVDGGVTCRL